MSALRDGLPAAVKVGPIDYAIEVLGPLDAREQQVYGKVIHEQQRIQIDLQHGPQRAGLALLHELLHACFAVHGVDLGKAEEEAVVHALTTMLGGAMRDTPEAFDWILEHVSGGSPAARQRLREAQEARAAAMEAVGLVSGAARGSA